VKWNLLLMEEQGKGGKGIWGGLKGQYKSCVVSMGRKEDGCWGMREEGDR